jgi:hypothetical protein
MSSGGRRGGGGDESEDEGYVVGELGDHSGKLSWKKHMALFRRELSTGSRLLRDGSRPGSRWERFLIHPDYWYVPSLSLSLSLTCVVLSATTCAWLSIRVFLSTSTSSYVKI